MEEHDQTTTFRAAVVTAPGRAPTRSRSSTSPSGALEPGQVRVAVAAATVNPVDLAVRDGCHAPGRASSTSPSTPASAGTSPAPSSRPARASTWRPAPAWPAWSAGWTATSAPTPSSWCCRPRTWPSYRTASTLAEAATVPLNALTALQLVDILGDGEGRSLLVTGAAGAVGRVRRAVRARARLAGDRAGPGGGRGVRARARRRVHLRADHRLGRRGRRRRAPGAGGGAGPRRRPVRRRAAGVPARLRARRQHRGGQRGAGRRRSSAGLLERTAQRRAPARVAEVLPLDRYADAHAAVAKGGVRGRYVLVP